MKTSLYAKLKDKEINTWKLVSWVVFPSVYGLLMITINNPAVGFIICFSTLFVIFGLILTLTIAVMMKGDAWEKIFLALPNLTLLFFSIFVTTFLYWYIAYSPMLD